MNQEIIRRGQRRRRELFVYEGDLNKGHREDTSHAHPSVNSGEVLVTNFARNDKGEFTEVRTIIGRER